MASASLLGYSPFQGGWAGKAYNEHAFRHFLTIERTRADQSACSFLLVLVSLKRHPGSNIRIAPSVSAALFSGLGLCVREVDFVGWFREDRVAGAVLAQGEKLHHRCHASRQEKSNRGSLRPPALRPSPTATSPGRPVAIKNHHVGELHGRNARRVSVVRVAPSGGPLAPLAADTSRGRTDRSTTARSTLRPSERHRPGAIRRRLAQGAQARRTLQSAVCAPAPVDQERRQRRTGVDVGGGCRQRCRSQSSHRCARLARARFGHRLDPAARRCVRCRRHTRARGESAACALGADGRGDDRQVFDSASGALRRQYELVRRPTWGPIPSSVSSAGAKFAPLSGRPPRGGWTSSAAWRCWCCCPPCF